MFREIKHLKQILIMVSLSYFFFMFGNGIVTLTNPDEVFYAQTAKEMVQHNTWMTPYLFGAPQFEKPVLLYWLLRIGFIFFGVNSFAARFFPALFAMIGVISVYFLSFLGTKSEEKAFLSSVILMSSGLYIGLARTLFTDMIFSIFILLSLSSFFWGYFLQRKKAAGLLLFFIFSGLAVLTKGPLGFLIPFLIIFIFLLIKKNIRFLLCKYSLWGIVVFSLISLPWYVFMINKYGSNFIHEFFYNDHIRRIIQAEHAENDRWYFYPNMMFLCMFPWSLYLIAALVYLARYLRRDASSLHIFLACWICVVFLVFQAAHSKLASYIFPLFPAFAVIIGDFIYTTALLKSNSRLLSFIWKATLFIFLLIPIGLIIAIIKYPMYLSLRTPVYFSILALFALIILMLFLMLQRKLLKSIYLSIFITPILIYLVLFMSDDISPYLSSQKSCEFLLKNYTITNTILCSRSFVRGVRYYTGKEVAVVVLPSKPFFSPHPIPFLDTDQKVKDLLHKQPVSYCIIKKSSMDDIERITDKEFKFTILKIIGNECILKIEKPVL